MSKAVQFYNNATSLYDQYDVTTEDITLPNASLAKAFYTLKDSKDNIYILCGGANFLTNAKIIAIDSQGNKRVATFGNNVSAYFTINGTPLQLMLSRDETKLCIWMRPQAESVTYDRSYYEYALDFENGETIPEGTRYLTIATTSAGTKFAIYQDRYFWLGTGSSYAIYDYTTKSQLASLSASASNAMAVSTDNILYSVETTGNLSKCAFNGISTITRSILVGGVSTAAKQMVIDKWGDLIILTNSGTASTLLKYTTTGTLIHNMNLVNPYYNLNTDSEGNYYYSDALGTYRISANTTQGQEFTGVGTKILDSGMTTYGNDLTGYSVSANGSVGC